MDIEQAKIKIPDTGGSLTVEDVKKETDSRFKDVNYILLSVVIILLVMVATLLIDSFHINSATYREYSQKTDAIEALHRSNESLLMSTQENQRVIIELQNQLQALLQERKNGPTP